MTTNKIDNIKKATKQALNTLKSSIPIMISILLLINLIDIFLKDYYSKIFTGNELIDSFIGATAGSLSFGIPLTSYIVGGELLKSGISLVAITAFILSWSTVGIAMLPLESKFLGKKFAFVRNTTNFIFAIIIAILTTITLNLI